MPLNKSTKAKCRTSCIHDLYYFNRKGEEYLASCGDGKIIRIFNISDPNQLDYLAFVLKGHTKPIMSLAIAPNKNFLFSGGKDTYIRCWDLVKSKCQCILKKHTNTVTCLTLNQHGCYLLSGSADKSICVWSVIYSEKGSKINKITLLKRLVNTHE